MELKNLEIHLSYVMELLFWDNWKIIELEGGHHEKRKAFCSHCWQYNVLRHNLDVIHIEKNVCDNIIGTLLNLDKKSATSKDASK